CREEAEVAMLERAQRETDLVAGSRFVIRHCRQLSATGGMRLRAGSRNSGQDEDLTLSMAQDSRVPCTRRLPGRFPLPRRSFDGHCPKKAVSRAHFHTVRVMVRATAAVVSILLLTHSASASAQSLRGSRSSMHSQNRIARDHRSEEHTS